MSLSFIVKSILIFILIILYAYFNVHCILRILIFFCKKECRFLAVLIPFF